MTLESMFEVKIIWTTTEPKDLEKGEQKGETKHQKHHHHWSLIPLGGRIEQ